MGNRLAKTWARDFDPKSPLTSTLFATAKGRKFGSWIDEDSRDNGNNETGLIENPAFVIESILRDVLGNTSTVINYASFDVLGNTSDGRRNGWKVAKSIISQKNSLDVINDICRESAMYTIHDFSNQERVVAIDHYNPADQLANADIVFENGKPQVRVRQTHVKYIYNEFYLNYKLNYATGNYDKQYYITAAATNMASDTRSDNVYDSYTGLCTGSQALYNVVNRWTYDADWIRDDTTAEYFIKTMADWLALRKWEVEATLWYSAKTLKLEPLDQVTWNLDLLPISIRDVQVSDLAGSDGAGGALADDTYYYVISGVDAHGEGKISNEATVVVSGQSGAGSVELNCTALPDILKYRVYRGTASGTYGGYYETDTLPFTDTGAAFDGTTACHTSANAFFISNVVDYGLKGGGRIKMNFHLCPYVFL